MSSSGSFTSAPTPAPACCSCATSVRAVHATVAAAISATITSTRAAVCAGGGGAAAHATIACAFFFFVALHAGVSLWRMCFVCLFVFVANTFVNSCCVEFTVLWFDCFVVVVVE